MSNGARKGSSFEREICKQLSSWWTYGTRDDIFWRSSQSGGRATVRGRKGKSTAGSYGDIVALDPIGNPFLNVFTPELKRGKSHGDPGDLLDCNGDRKKHPFVQTLEQASAASDLAQSRSWLVIAKRDRHHIAVFFPSFMLNDRALVHARAAFLKPPVFRYRLLKYDFVGMRLDKFLSSVDPAILAENQG